MVLYQYGKYLARCVSDIITVCGGMETTDSAKTKSCYHYMLFDSNYVGLQEYVLRYHY